MTRAVLGLLTSGILGLSVAQAPFKVLMIEGTTADHTPTSDASKPVLMAMAAANNFTIDFSSDHTLINDANLAKYQVFLQMNLYPFDLSPSEQAAFQKFVESGKGWVGVHASGCANNGWPWYAKFLGDVTWMNHANLRDGNLIFEDRNHPITANMPASLIIKDEWYQFSKSPRAKVRVLAKADEKNYSPYNANGDHPIVWVLSDYARAVYISIGHDPNDWKVPDYVTLIHDAILWANPQATRVNSMGEGKRFPGRSMQGKAWIRDGILNLEQSLSCGACGHIRLLDAVGRNLTLIPEGAARFRILGSGAEGSYYLWREGATLERLGLESLAP